MKKTVWNWVQVVVLALVGLSLWTGCRTTINYVNSVHNEQTGGAVETELSKNNGEMSAESQQGKTITTETAIPEAVLDSMSPEASAAQDVIEAVADAVEEEPTE